MVVAFNYDDSIRPDIGDAHRAYWEKLTRPGNWWTSAERIAIAEASRLAPGCEFCQQRQQALSPYTVKGEHQVVVGLPSAAVDAVHRIVTDQTRITAQFVNDNELTKAAYVELVGIVVAVLSIDEFHRALGLPLEPLPQPGEGEPDGYLPPQAAEGTGFVPMIPADGATGKESDLWAAGRAANVIRALSLVPNAVRDWIAISNSQYLSFEQMGNFVEPENRAINRMQIELVAGRVSAINECFY